MTLFDCPSPKGTNHAGLYLNSAGYLFDRNGGYWGKSQIKKMALDEEPGHGEVAEALLKLRVDLEECISESHLDLHPEAKAAILKCLDRHVRPGQHQKRGMGPGYYKGHGATDDTIEERAALRRVSSENGHDADAHDLESFVKFLRQRGLDEEAIREAIAIVQGSGETADAFPVSGVLGGALSGQHRDIGESVYQKHGVTHHSHHGTLDAQRRADALDAVRRVGFVAGAEPAGRRLTRQERRAIAAGHCSRPRLLFFYFDSKLGVSVFARTPSFVSCNLRLLWFHSK
jgi:hypothetical protein